MGMYQYLDWNLVREMDQLQHLMMKNLNLNPSYIYIHGHIDAYTVEKMQ